MSDIVEEVVEEVSSWFRTPKNGAEPVRYPETAQDGGTPATSPNMDSKYFQPKYPGSASLGPVGVLPSTESPDAHWLESTKQGHFAPYRGDVPHGVNIHVNPDALPVADIDLIAARGHGFGHPVGDQHQVPVPVVMVDTPSFFGIEKKFTTNVWTLVTSTPQLIAARRPERSVIRLSGTAAFQIGQTVEQVVAGIGFTVPANVVFTMNVNQPVYAIATTGNPVVSVYEEFTVVEGSKRL